MQGISVRVLQLVVRYHPRVSTPGLRRARAHRRAAFGFALAISACLRAEQSSRTPTFTEDVAPLLYRACVPCHQRDGDAPFPLETFDQVSRRARQIAEVTARRYMPPWKPATDSPAFVGERRLRREEIELIDRWVKEGAFEGPTRLTPAATHTDDGWLWGKPDLILNLPAFALRADGLDVFRNFVVPVPGGGARYVRALQFRPRSRAVHHANIRVDRTPASRALDEADPGPGYEGVILHSAQYPDGHFLGWTPGQAAPPDGDLAWRLEGGSDLVVQLHLRPTGRLEHIAPSIGLYFTDTAPARIPSIVRLGRQNLDIPRNAADYRVMDSFALPVDVDVVAIQPHAHYRVRDVVARATLPDGSSRTLIHITDWDFSWQDLYRLARPLALPAGTRLEMTYSFDNTEANPRNPTRPPERASWGWRSSDEMGDVWIQMLTRNDPDRRTLTAAATRKMTEEDAVGAEVLVARQPDHVSLRNDAAMIYQELGRPEQALTHFSAVTRLTPGSPAAHYNEGVALDLLHREDDALARYREAIRLDPTYARAHASLANLFYRSRRVEDAIAEYRVTLGLEPANATTRCSLARALTDAGRPAEAVAEYRTALAAEPDSTPCLINFAWLLSAHRDPAIRRPAEAAALAEHAATLTGRASAEALDALAAAYASGGRYDAAVETASSALKLLRPDMNGNQVREIRERLELYRRHEPFIVPE